MVNDVCPGGKSAPGGKMLSFKHRPDPAYSVVQSSS